MGKSVQMRRDSGPEPGDIVISSLPHVPNTYTLSMTSGPAQMVFGSYEKALARAQAFAARACVDVWVLEGSDATLVAQHRAVTQKPREAAIAGRAR